MQKNKPILALYSGNGFEETFTKAHADLLGVTYKITGGTPPRFVNDTTLLPMDFISRNLRKIFKPVMDVNYPLRRFLQKNKVDIFMAEFGMSGAVVTPVCMEYGIPLIVNFYGIDAFGNEITERYKKEYKLMFEYASFFNVQSDSIRQRLIELGCSNEKIIVNSSPPSDLFFEHKVNSQDLVLVTVGRFVDKKAPHLTIMAFAEIAEKYSNAKLIMVGDGPLFNACKQLCRVWKIEDKVEFTGRVEQMQQLEIMKKASIYIQHSVTSFNGDKEGIPVSIMEASALGLPVVSTLHSGIPEVIEHKKTGLLVSEFNVDGFRDAILLLLQNPLGAREMGNKGRELMAQRYGMKKHIDILNDLIQRAAKNG